MGYAVSGNPEQVVRHGQEHVHNGKFWTVSHYFGDLADAFAAEILVIPNSKNIHMGFQFKAGGDAHLEIYQNPTIGDNGTQLNAEANNRANVITPEADVYHTPTITSAIDRMFNNYIIGGGGGNSVGGKDGVIPFEDGKWILAANNTYLIRATNESGASQKFAFAMAFWESELDKL